LKNIPNEIKVALLVALGVLVLYFGFNFLKGNKAFSSDNEYIAVYEDVKGLIEGNQVKISGLKVGKVSGTKVIKRGGNHLVAITFSVESGLKIPRSVKAEIVPTGLLGDMEIQLNMDGLAANEFENNIAQNGDTLTGTIQPSMIDALSEQVSPIAGSSQNLLVKVDSLTTTVNQLLESQQMTNILNSAESSAASLNATTTSLSKLVAAEQQSIANILNTSEQLILSLQSSTQQLQKVLNNTDQFTQNLAAIELDKTAAQLENTITQASNTFGELSTTIKKVNSMDGSLGLLMNDTKLYNNLNQTSKDLDRLIVDLRENPKRYVHFSVFGGKKKDKDEKETNEGEK